MLYLSISDRSRRRNGVINNKGRAKGGIVKLSLSKFERKRMNMERVRTRPGVMNGCLNERLLNCYTHPPGQMRICLFSGEGM